MSEEKLTLATMYDGAAIEAVDHELQNVVNNIIDVNTEAERIREVTLKIKIKPNKERNLGSVTFQATSKLAPCEALETSILIDRDKAGRGVAYEHYSRQDDFQGVLPIEGIK
jgi:hypothetical protein